jgi:hypothetical protein
MSEGGRDVGGHTVAGQSSYISHPNPQYLLVAVGW